MSNVLYPLVAAPLGAVNAVQLITLYQATPYRVSFLRKRTADIAADATNTEVQTALRALSTVGGSNVNVSGSPGGPYTVTFVGALAGAPQPLLESDFKNVRITQSVAGHHPTGYGLETGAVVATEEPALYQNTGTPTSPTLTAVGEGGSSTLAALTDVDLTSPQDGDTLVYNDGSGKWENGAAAGGSGIQTATVTLHHANIRDLPVTPYEIIPAPGENKIIKFFGGVAASNKAAGFYSGIDEGDICSLVYGADNGQASGYADTAGLLAGAGNSYWAINSQIALDLANGIAKDPQLDTASIVNQAINLLSYNNAAFEDGHADNTLILTVFYAVVSV